MELYGELFGAGDACGTAADEGFGSDCFRKFRLSCPVQALVHVEGWFGKSKWDGECWLLHGVTVLSSVVFVSAVSPTCPYIPLFLWLSPIIDCLPNGGVFLMPC